MSSRLEWIGLAACIIGVALLATLVLRQYLRSRITPEEIERRRREAISRNGKVGDGEIVEVDGVTVAYEWQVAGVVYAAVQDVSALESLLPSDRMSLIGPVTIKFDPRNHANSIILSEVWSGLRQRSGYGA